eukprot:1564389-Pyramimonas_sp.AAC.1
MRHQRRVRGPVLQHPTEPPWSPLRVVVSTPDGDVHEELYDLTEVSQTAVRFEDSRRPRPPGLDAGSRYRYRRSLTAS